jgi:hypothetical protein
MCVGLGSSDRNAYYQKTAFSKIYVVALSLLTAVDKSTA